jgi:hypothetical protein
MHYISEYIKRTLIFCENIVRCTRKWHFPKQVLVQRFFEIDDESFLRQNSAANKSFEVSDGPFDFEVFHVYFAKMRWWEND